MISSFPISLSASYCDRLETNFPPILIPIYSVSACRITESVYQLEKWWNNTTLPHSSLNLECITVAPVPSNESWLVIVERKSHFRQNFKQLYLTDAVKCLTVIDEHYKSLAIHMYRFRNEDL